MTSPVLLKTERAFQTWMLGHAALLVSENGKYVVTNRSIRIELLSGPSFNLPVNRGQDDQELGAPAIVAACDDAVQAELRSLNWLVSTTLELRFPCDEKPTMSSMLDAFEYAAGGLSAALYKTELLDEVSALEPDFHLVARPNPWREQSGFTDRLRTYRWSTQFHVAMADLPKT